MPIIEKVCKPLVRKKYYDDIIQYRIERYFYDVIFFPLKEILGDVLPFQAKELKKTSYRNAQKPTMPGQSNDPVIVGLRNNTIQYSAGGFIGSFNARISKRLLELGAKYDKKLKKYHIKEKNLTIQIRTAIIEQKGKYKDALQEANNFLEIASENISSFGVDISFNKDLDIIINDMSKQFAKEIPSEVLAMAPELSPRVLDGLKKRYTEQINLAIKDFSVTKTQELRNMVQKSLSGGERAETLEKRLISQWGVSQRKAEFLAKQETALLLSTYDEERAAEAGIEEYIWQTAGDSRVRPEHRLLNGTRQRYDNPPIVDYRTGQRGNPGKAYGCRCVARKIIRWFIA